MFKNNYGHINYHANFKIVSLSENRGPGISVCIATDNGLDGPGSNPGDFPPVQTGTRAHPAICKLGTGSFPGGKVRPGRAAYHSPPSSAEAMEEQSYTSIHPLGHTWPVTGSLYLYLLSENHNINREDYMEKRQKLGY